MVRNISRIVSLAITFTTLALPIGTAGSAIRGHRNQSRTPGGHRNQPRTADKSPRFCSASFHQHEIVGIGTEKSAALREA